MGQANSGCITSKDHLWDHRQTTILLRVGSIHHNASKPVAARAAVGRPIPATAQSLATGARQKPEDHHPAACRRCATLLRGGGRCPLHHQVLGIPVVAPSDGDRAPSPPVEAGLEGQTAIPEAYRSEATPPGTRREVAQSSCRSRLSPCRFYAASSQMGSTCKGVDGGDQGQLSGRRLDRGGGQRHAPGRACAASGNNSCSSASAGDRKPCCG